MSHRNVPNIPDSDHNAEIREEIGHRLRMHLSKHEHDAPSRIQHLLNRLSRQDALKFSKRIKNSIELP
ncbi:hypothetical protein ABIE49_003063 [Bradyrhizobium sp. OAE829]